MKKSKIKALLCITLSLVLLLASVNLYASADDTTKDETTEEKTSVEEYKEQLNDLQSKQKQIQEEQSSLSKKISSAKKEKNELQAEVMSIDEQMDLKQQEIEVVEQKISLTTNYINNKLKQIELKEKDIAENLQIFRDRIRAMYVTGGYSDYTNSLLMLFTSRSVSEFLTRSEFLKRISEHDTELVQELKDELTALEEDKKVLEDEKAVLENNKSELNKANNELEEQKNIAKSSIQDINAMQKEYEANYAQLSEQSKAVQNEIADIYASLTTSTSDYVGGEMLWPVPNYYTISSTYGWRFNGSDFHTGMDITGNGVHGAKVIAANTGTVIFTKTCPYNGYSYGYGTYIIVDHGGGITTLYAHLSKITTSVGDVVVMGQQIGNVGNTGWSTGAHLHFEVRKDGKAVDPKPYVT